MSIWTKTSSGWVEIGGGGVPGAAVIGGATGAVTKSSFTGDGTNGEAGQDYDVYQFTGSGQINVKTPGLADYLIVGGGGAGGSRYNKSGGGGGAGAFLISENVYLETTAVVVGGGGAGTNNAPHQGTGTNGEPSQITAVSMRGGGRGGHDAGLNGGSGGGGDGGGAAGLAANPQHGNNGAAGTGTTTAGGGGGYSSAASGKTGGSAISTGFTGSQNVKELAGGGGGGASSGAGPSGGGGAGSGGAGANNGQNAVANTGSGGGGAGLTADVSGNGGDGVVIVRVKVRNGQYPFSAVKDGERTAHAARIIDGIVRQVIVIPHLDDDDAKITEYCNSIGLAGSWVDTSYTGSRRGKYAGVGDTFVSTKAGSEFISPTIEEEPVTLDLQKDT